MAKKKKTIKKEPACFPHKDLTAIVVLSDGETWATLDACCISIVNREQLEQIKCGEKDPSDLNNVLDIGLNQHFSVE
tara:strand:+ start:4483 stop:4713 length:231 start_codon:yes stop_codon:yes gene_type:complete